MTLEQQFQTILFMISSGFIVGFFFDGYRVLKGKMNFQSWLVFLIDLFFGVISALFIFALLLWSNGGQLRIIIIATFAMGLWLYYLILSRRMIRLWLTIYSVIYSFWRFLVKTVQIIIIKPILFLYKLVLIVLGAFVSSFYWLFNFSRKLFIPPTLKLVKTTKKTGKHFNQKLKAKLKKKAGIRSLLKKWFKWKK